MVAHAERRKAVQKLRTLARHYDIAQVNDSAGKAQVHAMADKVLAAPTLTEIDRIVFEDTLAVYNSAWIPAAATGAGDADGAPHGALAASISNDANSPNGSKEWKFHAAQPTYNSTEGEWAANDKQVLRTLFERFLVFARRIGKSLKAEHMSVAMEESEEDHVHIHVYFNSSKVFHHKGRDALAIFAFEEIHPRVVPNRASGGRCDPL